MISDSDLISQNQQAPNATGTSNAKTHNGGSIVPSESGGSGTPPTETHCTIICKPEKDWWDKLKKWAEIVGVIALVIYTAYTIKMYQATKLAAEAAHDSAVAAQSAANTAGDTLKNQKTTFQIEQRPYIVADIPQFLGPLAANAPIKANITLKNIGKTPALNVVWNEDLDRFSPGPTRTAFLKFVRSHYQALSGKNSTALRELASVPLALSPRRDLAPEATTFSTNSENVILSTDELVRLQSDNANILLYYMAVVNYSDAFGNSYKTQACYVFFGKNQTTWHICDNHNTIE